jgi:hypothetical protein
MVDTTTVQKPEFATELKPLAEAVYGATVPQFQKRLAEGYITPTTPLVTPFSAEELQSMAGISALARGPGATPSYQFGQQMAGMAAAPIGEVDISRLMSPYMSGVTEAAKRRAVEDFQRTTMQPLMTRATSEGGLRGSRAAIERSQAYEGLGRNLADIEATGLQKAYEQAIAAAQAERNRMLQAAPQYAQLGQSGFEADVQRLGLLSGVGETQRTMADALRQAQLGQEVAALNYPEAVFSQYTGFLGQPGSGRTDTVIQPEKPSGISQAIGTGINLLGAVPKAVQGIQSIGNLVGGLFNQGGQVGGLSSIVRRANGGRIVRLNAGGRSTTEDQIKDLQQASIKQATEAYLADALAEQQRKAAEKAALEKSWSYQLFGVTDPDRTALEAQRIGEAIMQPTEKTTRFGQAVEAITRGFGAKAEQDIEYEKQLAAKRAARQKTTQENLKSALDVAKEMRQSEKEMREAKVAEYEPLIKLYGSLVSQQSALSQAFDPVSAAQAAEIGKILPGLSKLIVDRTGIPMIGQEDTAVPIPPSTGGSTSAKQHKRGIAAAADEVLRRKAAEAGATQTQAK